MKHDRLSFYEREEGGAPVTLLSVPLELGSDERGLAEAPKYLQQHGVEKLFPAIGREIAEHRSFICPKPHMVASAGTMKNVHEIVSVAKRTRAATEKAGKRGDTVVALGGDHSMSLGTIAGAAAAHSSLGLIYIDAHPDCTMESTTATGNVHGMIVSSATGQGNSLLTDLFTRKIRPEHVLYIGIKDIDAPEITLIRESGIRYFSMLDVAADGLRPLFREISALSQTVEKVWVSMDLDSIDEQYAPGVAMTTQGGLTRREVMSLAHYVGKVCNVAGLDIAEMLPAKDKDGITARLTIELIARFLGGQYDWYENYMAHYKEINVIEEREKVAVGRRGNTQH